MPSLTEVLRKLGLRRNAEPAREPSNVYHHFGIFSRGGHLQLCSPHAEIRGVRLVVLDVTLADEWERVQREWESMQRTLEAAPKSLRPRRRKSQKKAESTTEIPASPPRA